MKQLLSLLIMLTLFVYLIMLSLFFSLQVAVLVKFSSERATEEGHLACLAELEEITQLSIEYIEKIFLKGSVDICKELEYPENSSEYN